MALEQFDVIRKEAALSNGMRLVLFERPGMPVYIRVAFHSGSRLDREGKEGTAHFLEHMLVAGTKDFPTKDKLAAHIERLGGVFGATTSTDSLNINVAVGDPADSSEAFGILNQMLFHSLFESKTLETERGSVLGELRDLRSNPGRLIGDLTDELAFQGTILARSTIGSERTINRIGREDILDFYNKNMTAARSLLIISGGITLDQARELAEKNLSLPTPETPDISPVSAVQRIRVWGVEQFPGISQVHIGLSFRTPDIFHPDDAALDVLRSVLAGGRASVLARKLRYEKGLVYSVVGEERNYFDTSCWGIFTSAKKDDVREVLKIIFDELHRVADQGLSTDEVKFAQDKIIKSQRMNLQTSAAWVGAHSYRQLISADPWTVEDYMRNIAEVTPIGTQKVAKAYLSDDKWYLALCGDIPAGEGFSSVHQS